jgi:hypothetical protein
LTISSHAIEEAAMIWIIFSLLIDGATGLNLIGCPMIIFRNQKKRIMSFLNRSIGGLTDREGGGNLPP